jgi:hypothetical protein
MLSKLDEMININTVNTPAGTAGLYGGIIYQFAQLLLNKVSTAVTKVIDQIGA